MASASIVLFSSALRLADNAALQAAVDAGGPIVPVYVFDEHSPKVRPLGGASKWWLLQSLTSLQQDLHERGSDLVIRCGNTADCVAELATEIGATRVMVTRGYTPGAVAAEQALHKTLGQLKLECRRFGGNLLLEPEMVRTKTGTKYTVFTPYWRTASELIDTTEPQPAPAIIPAPERWPEGQTIGSLGLEPKPAHWAEPIAAHWQPGEEGARERLAEFLEGPVQTYKQARDFPATDATSSLSPHLAFGEISPRTLWFETKKHMEENKADVIGGAHFLRELGWREFSTHLLFHFPEMQTQPMRTQFANFPWRKGHSDMVRAWQKGQTGFPIVDAGMRQLWQTGWMHNRVRMIVASFLVKDLLWHWHEGEAWFWDTLVDADFANNIASWQWVAGCGADASPYFRIFNPTTQGEKFDKAGAYVRRFVPELANLPDKYIHDPSEAPAGVLEMAGIKLGETYPKPIIDRKQARAEALAALASIKQV